MRALFSSIALMFIVADAPAANWDQADEYRPGFITGAADAVISWVSQECSVIMTAIRNVKALERVEQARQAGRLKLIKERLNYNPAENLFGEIHKDGRVSEKYPLARLKKMLKETDQIYGLDGQLVRYRKSDDTAFVIPREIEKHLVLANVLTEQDLGKARQSWVEDNFFPQHPLLKDYARIFSGPRSTWTVGRNATTYEVEVDAQKPNKDRPWKFDRIVGFKFKFTFFADGRSSVSMGLRLREFENGTVKLELAKYFINQMRWDADDLEELWETFRTGTPFVFEADEAMVYMLEHLTKQLDNGRLKFDIFI